jgi:hypothetical protein
MNYSVHVLPIPWRECLLPAARILTLGLKGLGILKYGDNASRRIVLGAHAVPSALRESDIIYNTEHPKTCSRIYSEVMRTHETWSYTRFSLAAKHVPLGYVPPELAEGPPSPPAEQDIDVLFVGSLNDRRRAILAQLQAFATVRVVSTGEPVFGQALIDLEARSKIVLNLHYYQPGIFESSRVVPAVARGSCVLSEPSEEGYGLCAMSSNVVEAVRRLLPNQEAREYVAKTSLTNLRKVPMLETLRKILA